MNAPSLFVLAYLDGKVLKRAITVRSRDNVEFRKRRIDFERTIKVGFELFCCQLCRPSLQLALDSNSISGGGSIANADDVYAILPRPMASISLDMTVTELLAPQ
ncbi:hypothetical protein ACFSE1_06035 [Rhizobium helianthi]|uniref:Uncharacterized protein n=1 Tax=Rhizobium helianthi TaxID=1132695 RepID=A0ABW4M3E4_9HYPH